MRTVKSLYHRLLFVTACSLISCQQEEIATPDQRISNRSYDCNEVCIDPNDPVYHEYFGKVNQNSGPQVRQVDYTIYNTLTGIELEWAYSSTNSSKRRLVFTVSGAGFDSPQTFTSDCGGSGTYTFNFTTAWDACDVVNFTAKLVDCEGNDIPTTGDISGSYVLVGACNSCPGNTFTAEVTCNNDEECNRSVTFTFTAGEGGHYYMTTLIPESPLLCSISAGSLDITVIGDFFQKTIIVKGYLQQCEEISFTINWNSSVDFTNEILSSFVHLNNVLVASLEHLACQ